MYLHTVNKAKHSFLNVIKRNVSETLNGENGGNIGVQWNSFVAQAALRMSMYHSCPFNIVACSMHKLIIVL